MRNRVKKVLALMLAISCCCVFSANAYGIQYRFINELITVNEVTISNGKEIGRASCRERV